MGLIEAEHGSVPRKSTCSQLLTMTQDYARYNNDRVPFHAVYFVQESAFDKVDHCLLLDKMPVSVSTPGLSSGAVAI